jgi:hypothetical protein
MKGKIKLHPWQWTTLALIPIFFTMVTIRGCYPQENQQNLTVINRGERVTGNIVSTDKTQGYERGSEASVKYTFTTLSGVELSGSYILSSSTVKDLYVGGELEIAYDAQNPTRNLPALAKEQESDYRGRVWTGIILVSLILCGIASFLGYVAWESWRLEKKYHL